MYLKADLPRTQILWHHPHPSQIEEQVSKNAEGGDEVKVEVYSIVLTAALDMWTMIRKLVQARWTRSQNVLWTWPISTGQPQVQALQHWVRGMVP